MDNEFIDKTFADLDIYYPGSKRKRHEPKKAEVVTEASWDAKPYIKTLPSGKDVEMFTLGALATALGRPIITVRAWIKEGYLPTSPYRLPTKKNKNGEDHQGRRLYTRPMIEEAINIFTSAGLMGSSRIEWSKHRLVANQLNEAWSNLREE